MKSKFLSVCGVYGLHFRKNPVFGNHLGEITMTFRLMVRVAGTGLLAGVLGLGAGCQMFKGEEIKPKPISVLAWNIDELGKASPYADSPYPNITQFYWLNQSNLADVAGAKKMTDKQPVGHRVIFSWDVHRLMYTNPADKLTTEQGDKFTAYWWDHGVVEFTKQFDQFMRKYHALGGKLDYFIIDSEHIAGAEINTPERWATVAKDPRFATILKDLDTTSSKEFDGQGKPLAHAYWRYQNYLSWKYMEKMYEIVRKYYPQVKFSDYAAYNKLTDMVAWGHWRFDRPVPGQYGHHVGTHQSPSLYGVITYLGEMEVDGKKFGFGPFRSLMLAVNQGRASVLSSPVPFAPWIAWRGYCTDYENKPVGEPPRSHFGNSDYYQELVFHAAMLNPDFFLMWSACRWRLDQATDDWCQPEHLQLVDQMMNQLNALVGFSDRKTLVDSLSTWHAPFLLSGCVANGQSVWRLTPDPVQSQIQIPGIVISEDPLTIKLGHQTLVMPGGKISRLEPKLSAVGYWIVGPANLRPQITEP